MGRFRVALLQLVSCGCDQVANLAKGERFCRRAKQMGADIALFPEMWNVGCGSTLKRQGKGDLWRSPKLWDQVQLEGILTEEERRRFLSQAVGEDDEFVARFRELAQELAMAIGVTYLQKWPGAPRNCVSVIDRHGEIVMTYAKVHTCDFDEPEKSLTPGEDFYVCDLDTSIGPVRVGAMICFDREFPESARILMLQNAEVILIPNACELEEHRLNQLSARAYENMVGVAMTNYAAPQNNGCSVAYDGMAFEQGGRSRSMLVVQGSEGEDVLLADFDIDALRAYRRREVWGNSFRRPHRYSALTSLTVDEPFLRVNTFGKPYPRTKR